MTSKKPELELGDELTSEYDPVRGYWVRSEEGDIIRQGGERGYWSKEPPRPEFRAERRRILQSEKGSE